MCHHSAFSTHVHTHTHTFRKQSIIEHLSKQNILNCAQYYHSPRGLKSAMYVHTNKHELSTLLKRTYNVKQAKYTPTHTHTLTHWCEQSVLECSVDFAVCC